MLKGHHYKYSTTYWCELLLIFWDHSADGTNLDDDRCVFFKFLAAGSSVRERARVVHQCKKLPIAIAIL